MAVFAMPHHLILHPGEAKKVLESGMSAGRTRGLILADPIEPRICGNRRLLV
jgi:hypothetical protein